MKYDSKICHAVVEALAARDRRGSVESVEHDDPSRTRSLPRGTKSVELLAWCADGTNFACEHTRIEAYPEQLHEGRQLIKLLAPLQDSEMARRLPESRSYILSVPIGALCDKSLDPAQVQASVAAWVSTVAGQLHPGTPGGGGHIAEGYPPEVAVPVRVTAWPADAGPPRLVVARELHEDAETAHRLRVERIVKAFGTKLPKLLLHTDAQKVLVLHDLDIAASSRPQVHRAVREAAHVALTEGARLCDLIVLVESDRNRSPIHSAYVLYQHGIWIDENAPQTLQIRWPTDPDDALTAAEDEL